MTTRRLRTTAVLLGAAVLLGCAVSDYDPSKERPIAPPNVYLYLSNQSTERSRVVLAVYVDGDLEVRRSMKSVFIHAYPHVHGFPDEIPLLLAPGSHTIRVVAEGTTAGAEAEIVVGAAPVHVDAAFDYSSRSSECGPAGASVTIHVSAERPGFC